MSLKNVGNDIETILQVMITWSNCSEKQTTVMQYRDFISRQSRVVADKNNRTDDDASNRNDSEDYMARPNTLTMQYIVLFSQRTVQLPATQNDH